MSDSSPPLPQSAGYSIVVGLGVAFALGDFGRFMVANRIVGTGLTAAAVISSWLYSTALLGSTLLTYRYGLALGVWWGASASTMVCFLAVISIQTKRRAPNAHTMLELIRVRYGASAHILWIVLCLVNNLLMFSSMLLGASTAVTALTGMSVIASTYLMPLGVAIYTYFGGLRATFLTDYIHTFIIMIILVWLMIKIIAVKEIGSLGALYDAVISADQVKPVEGNYQGSHLTMRSEQCLYFGILHVITNFGSVVMDTGFWQKAFSADVTATVPGYILGGVASFSVPWTVGTIGGLAAIALESTSAWPTYPRNMTEQEVASGLVLPYVVQTVAGKGGAVALLLTIFMATTSVASAQMIATSSIVSFDIYGTYINPRATNKDLIRWSHIGVIATALVISSIATGFHKGGVDMTWLFYAMGNLINPGVFPTCFALFWRGQSKAAAITAPLVGVTCGLSVWLGSAYAYYGGLSITSTGSTLPCLFGCITAFFVPLPVTLVISLAKPANFEWSRFGAIKTIPPDGANETKATQEVRADESPERVKYMRRMSRWAVFWAVLTVIGHILLWPLPMYGAKMVFSKSFFTAWIVISLVYLWFTLLVSNVYPLVDGGAKKIYFILSGRTSEGKPSGGSSETSDVESPKTDAEVRGA
ncbi:LOW QUALITY PROTEIN: urea-proton symporter [Geosmithia morbida]|uniref:Urea-proton symporter n=1 Tax=Geosmithia morbida TaxID=1094350 RepID=A0A9P4Z052_9HYPO|nr:LOW QUALITY PROTEIN: urea-proton symporter [Geosmithia morbida]KAF4126263.1 LOW QUALITY PROTEIN: urea-proton symporter [Geosmithia morbida]